MNGVNLNELLYYDETSPSCLRWKAPLCKGRGSHNRKDGTVAGSNKSRNRWQFVIQGKNLLGHHVVWWLLNQEEVPEGFVIDHIDRNPLNNLITNLRVIPAPLNPRNASKYKTNSTGVTGVLYSLKADARDGSISERFIAHWNSSTGKRCSKSFSTRKYGHDLAFQLACDYRAKMIAELNAQGAGYTETHGKIVDTLQLLV